uniref:CSON003367 protein n=1 Tax=Culicoides sonorensis TaxID=179676 RepID=A0A336MPS5_CULSO
MGKLLSLLAYDRTHENEKTSDIFLDFENCVPSPNEKRVFEEVEHVLRQSDSILEEIQCYKGAGKEIREAISNVSPEIQEKAWSAVVPLVEKLKRCFDHSIELERVVPILLEELVGGNRTPRQHLEEQQALVKQLAEILEFVLKFDEYKMKTPAIQNDFSYYRRVVSRQRLDANNAVIPSDIANRMSLFYAHATPMLKVLSEATSKFVEQHSSDTENTTETLGTMAKVCLRMLENQNLLRQMTREETQLLVLRVMVGLVILYDHVHPDGAFKKNSHVDVKGCVKLLQAQPPAKSEPLLNALRYTTKHLNEENTPKNIKNLLAA